ncbi:MAG: phosphatidate cytidylyltransferase [Chloroflexi bacterium]|jgi:phosphatidate cytidylyltransferase|nr:phosphatidate cytidylyltransferase [Chloroflexota bacterium]MBT4004279.1 phosphatidate cytidylyltransferase [Chloroflexota bacterium]MBT4305724.1 phosphatidate cytidylyltransferase [Chloroflexota bacterium]MBT4533548.1 phosphatidate cytidylyltransferase [Chloroflexota bacterium]MBT4681809.1 phosphatidate cytidylyltransferase [Chloroflexota bacterium]
MLKQRVLVAAVLLPIGITAIVAGGWIHTSLMALIVGLAAWEYATLSKAGGKNPSAFFVLIGALLLVIGRNIFEFEVEPSLIAFIILIGMGIHLISFEKGRDQAASDFSVSLTGVFYFGILGGYFVSLRNLPNGLWWILLVLPSIWLADSGAYFIGKKFGKHKMAPRLSPKKSWEGYFGGILVASIGTPLLLLLYQTLGLEQDAGITTTHAIWIGLAMSLFPTLGDLGESMIKREVGVKDSGTLLPGHGGMFDRIDSWLWGATIGYYLINWFFI